MMITGGAGDRRESGERVGQTVRISYASLDTLSAAVTRAGDAIEIGARIRSGQGTGAIGSDTVANALSTATTQQVQRSVIVAEAVRAAGVFPRTVKRSYQDADSAQASAVSR